MRKGKDHDSRKGGVHITRVASPWLKKYMATANTPPHSDSDTVAPYRKMPDINKPEIHQTGVT